MGDFFSPSTTETKQKSEPWKPQQDFLKYGFDEAARIYQQPGPEYFPNSTVAGFSPNQETAFQMGTDRATQGNQTMQAAEGYTQDVLGGKYLNSDPYQDDVFQNVQQRIMPGINSQFSNSGRYGSGLHQGEAIDRMTTAYAPIASQQYQQGLNRMDGAAAMAPVFAANDYRDIGALEAIGGQQQQLGQREIDDQARRWSYYQDLPANKLGQYASLISGNYGGVQTASQPGPSPFASILGGGLALAGTAGGLGWAPFGM
jgi:hypothetical protein